MIYLIQDCYKDNDGNYIDILKIGYSKDDFNIIRKSAYDTHNYGYTLLNQKEGSIELEKFLHKKFKDLLLTNSTEWFVYSQEIIDTFNNITDKDILEEDIITREEYIELCRKYIVNSLIPDYKILYNKHIDDLIQDLRNDYENLYKDILDWEENIYINHFLEGLLFIWESNITFWNSYNFEKELQELPDKINVKENPWKNRAEFYYKTLKLDNIQTQKDFDDYINKKIKKTKDLLSSYETTKDFAKHTLAEKYEFVAKTTNYSQDYIAVNHHLGKDLVPVFNNLVMISEKRAFDIQQYDYKDRFSVFNTIQSEDLINDNSSYNIKLFLSEFDKLPTFKLKMKYLCEFSLSELELDVVLDQIPLTYKQYYELLGKDRIRALSYDITDIRKYMSDLSFNKENLIRDIQLVFQVGQRYTKAYIKETLKNIYDSLGYNKTPKAVDIEEYFKVKSVLLTISGKRENGFEIVSKKEKEVIE